MALLVYTRTCRDHVSWDRILYSFGRDSGGRNKLEPPVRVGGVSGRGGPTRGPARGVGGGMMVA